VARFAIAARLPTTPTSRAVVPAGAVTAAAVPLPVLAEGSLLGPQLLAIPARAGIKLLGSGFIRTGPELGPTTA
jgi:hypothetical protein